MATLKACDYSYSRPSPRALYAAGVRGVGRYITDPNPGWKGISQAEYDRLTAAGLSVFFVWEDGPTAARLGRARGVADAQHAQRNLNRLSGPSNRRPVYFAVDYDANPDAVRAYFEGVKSVIGKSRTGAYGSYRVLKALKGWGLISFTFQTVAWSGASRLSGMNVLQHDVDTAGNPVVFQGSHVDWCRTYTSNYGQKAVLLSAAKPVIPTAEQMLATAYKAAMYDLQAHLKRNNYYDGEVDGDPGPLTKKAAQRWARDRWAYRGLIDGEWGELTYEAFQRKAKRDGGYEGPIDGKPGIYTWRGLAAAL